MPRMTFMQRIRAAGARLDAARSRIAPAGARPDPMIMAGFQNVPAARPSLSREDMTMAMVGVSQTITLGEVLLAPVARRAQHLEVVQHDGSLRKMRPMPSPTAHKGTTAQASIRGARSNALRKP